VGGRGPGVAHCIVDKPALKPVSLPRCHVMALASHPVHPLPPTHPTNCLHICMPTAVRGQVLHTLCDGSPAHMEDAIMDAVASFNGDEDKVIRRRANKVMGTYRATGKWNIL
jgi:hypothetical protein